MRHSLPLVLTGALLLTGGPLALAQQDQQSSQQALSDPAITTAISQRLLRDPGVSGFLMDVVTEDGIVTLSGTANNLLARSRAARLAETVKGVRAVNNQVEVITPPRQDIEIHDDIILALTADPAADAYELEIQVDDGMVSVQGVVDSWQEQQLVSKLIRRVRGVEGISNEIEFDYATQRTEKEIETEVEQALAWDALIDDALISVNVDDRTVTLAGHVGSAAEKTRAVRTAWVAGVQNVEATDLMVDTWARDPRLREGKYTDKSPGGIEQAVQRVLHYHPRVPAEAVTVMVDDNVVTLTGKVDNVVAKRAAGTVAGNVVGVWRVKNNLLVRPGTPSDPTIAERVENALLSNPYLNPYEFTVAVENGVVTLDGSVDSYFKKARADEMAASVYGVVAVDNNLIVSSATDPLAYNPYVDEEQPVDAYDWYEPTYLSTANDWELLEDVRDEIFWSPFVDGENIEVGVEDGIVTLTGMVETWNEYQEATEQAHEAGARRVVNDLAVEYGPDYYAPES